MLVEVDSQKVTDRKYGREQAKAVWELLQDSCAPGEQLAAACERLRSLMPAPVLKPTRPVQDLVPMTDEECVAFELETMPFGIHKGVPVGFLSQTDPSYLHAVTVDAVFSYKLLRYLASP